MEDRPKIPVDLVTHILHNTFERGGCLLSPIRWSFRDFQVEETLQRQLGRKWTWCLGGRVSEYHSLRQEKGGDDNPVVPVRAHGGRKESNGRQSGPQKSAMML